MSTARTFLRVRAAASPQRVSDELAKVHGAGGRLEVGELEVGVVERELAIVKRRRIEGVHLDPIGLPPGWQHDPQFVLIARIAGQEELPAEERREVVS
jgi:hypothetical protein